MKMSKYFIALQFVMLGLLLTSCKKDGPTIAGQVWTINNLYTSGMGVGLSSTPTSRHFDNAHTLSDGSGQPLLLDSYTNWTQSENSITFTERYLDLANTSITITEIHTGTISGNTMYGTFTNSELGSGTFAATRQ